MGYRITYGKNTNKIQFSDIKRNLYNRSVISVIVFILLLGIGWIGWKNQSIRHWLLPGDPEITETAIQEMIEDIKEGENMRDAVTAFCARIVEEATSH